MGLLSNTVNQYKKGQQALSSNTERTGMDYGNDILNDKYKTTVNMLTNMQQKSGTKFDIETDAQDLMKTYILTAYDASQLKTGGTAGNYLQIGQNAFDRALRQTVYKYQYGAMDAAGLEGALEGLGYTSQQDEAARTEKNVIARAKQLGAGNEDAKAYSQLPAIARKAKEGGYNALTEAERRAIKDAESQQDMGWLSQAVADGLTEQQAGALGQWGMSKAQTLKEIGMEDAEKYLADQDGAYTFAKAHPGDLTEAANAAGNMAGVMQQIKTKGWSSLNKNQQDAAKEVLYSVPGMDEYAWDEMDDQQVLTAVRRMTADQVNAAISNGKVQAQALKNANGLYLVYNPTEEQQFVLGEYRKTPEGAKQWAEEAAGTPEEQQAKDNIWFVTKKDKFDQVPTMGNYSVYSQYDPDFTPSDRDMNMKYQAINGQMLPDNPQDAQRYGLLSLATDEQRGIFNALLQTGRDKDANEYLAYITYELNQKANENAEKYMYDMGNNGVGGAIGASLLSVPFSLGRGMGYLDVASQYLQNQFEDYKPIDYNRAQIMGTAADAARQGVQDQVDWVVNILNQDVDLFDFVYGTAMSGLDSAAASVAGPWGGAVILGTGAAQSTAQDIHQRGGSDRQAVIGGALAGAFETMFEHWSLGKFYDEAAHLGKRNLKDSIINILAQSGINFSEEFFTELADMAADRAIMGDKSEAMQKRERYIQLGLTETEADERIAEESALRLLEAGFGGALMGGAFGAISNVASDARTNSQTKGFGQKISEDMRETLKTLSANLEGDAKALGQKYDPKNAKDKQTGELYRAVMQALPEEMRDPVKQGITLDMMRGTKGLTMGAADAIAAMLEGKQLDAGQLDALAGNEAGMQIIRDVFTGNEEQAEKEKPAAKVEEEEDFEPMPTAEGTEEKKTPAPKFGSYTLDGSNKLVSENETEQQEQRQAPEHPALHPENQEEALDGVAGPVAGRNADEGTNIPEERKAPQRPPLGQERALFEYDMDAGQEGQAESGEETRLESPHKRIMEIALDGETGEAEAVMADGTREALEDTGLDSEQQELAREAADLPQDEQAAMIGNWAKEAGQTVKEFAQGFKRIMDGIAEGKTAETVKSLYGEGLTKEQRAAAIAAGQRMREQRRAAILEKTRKTARESGFKALEDWKNTEAGLYLANVGEKISNKAQTMLKLMDQFAKETGLHVRVYDSLGKANGYLESGTNVVNIGLDAEEGALTRTLSHEGYHWISENAPEMAGKMLAFVKDTLAKTAGYDWETRVQEVMERYRDQAGQALTREQAEEELAADSMLDVIGTEENLKKLTKQEGLSFTEKVLGWINRTIERLRGIMDRLANKIPEIKALNGNIAYMEQIRDMYAEGIRQAKENGQAAMRTATGAAARDMDVKDYMEEMATATSAEDRQEAMKTLAWRLYARYFTSGVNIGAEKYEGAFEQFKKALSAFGSKAENSLYSAFQKAGLPAPKESMNAALAYTARQMAEGQKQDAGNIKFSFNTDKQTQDAANIKTKENEDELKEQKILDENGQNNYDTERRGDRNEEAQGSYARGTEENDGGRSSSSLRERVRRIIKQISEGTAVRGAAISINRGDYSAVIARGQQGYELFTDTLKDSKLVSKRGQPLIWYHGSDKKFTTFAGQKYGRNYDGTVGNYFTSEGEVAEYYAGNNKSKRNIYPVGVYSKNNIVFNASEFRDSYKEQNLTLKAIETARKYAKKSGINESFLTSLDKYLNRWVKEGKISRDVAGKIFDAFLEHGDIDSVVVKGATWDNGIANDQLIVFDSENIIPATSSFWNMMDDEMNRGKNDARFSLRTDTEAQDTAEALESVREDADLYAQMKQDENARAALQMLRQLHRQTTAGGENALIKRGAFEKRLSDIAGKIEEQTGTRWGHRKLMAELRKIYQAMEQDGYSVGEILQYTRGIMQQVLEAAPGVLVEQDESTKEALRILRTRPFYLSDEQKSEIRGTYGALIDYMKKNFGKLRIRKQDGKTASLADVWREDLAPLLSGTFAEDTNELDMPGILDAWIENANEKKFAGEFGANIGAYATDMALNAMLDFYDVPGALKSEADIRTEYEQKYNDLYEKLRMTRQIARQGVNMTKARAEERVNAAKEEAKARVKQLYEQYAENRKKAAEIRGKARDYVEKARKEYQDRYRERIEKDRARKAETEEKQKIINQIKKDVSWVKTRVIKPTDNRHIPEEYRGAAEHFVAFFLEDRAVFPDKDAIKIKDVLERMMQDERLHSVGGLDRETIDRLSWLQYHVATGTRLRDMTIEQLQQIQKVVGNLRVVFTQDTINIANREWKIETAINRARAELQGKKDASVSSAAVTARKWFFKELTPIYYAKRIGGVIGNAIQGLIDKQRPYAFKTAEAKEYLEGTKEKEGVIKKYNVTDWIFDKEKLRFTTAMGDEIELTRNQALTLRAWWKREMTNNLQDAAHLRLGGFTYDTADKDTRKLKGVNIHKSHMLKAADMHQIENWLTKEQKAFGDEMVNFLSTTAAAWGNEASMRMFGYNKYEEKYYFPYTTDSQYRGKGFDQENQGSKELVNMSSSHALTEHARNPLKLADFTDLWAGHVDQMAMYSAFAEDLYNIKRITNYVESAHKDGTEEERLGLLMGESEETGIAAYERRGLKGDKELDTEGYVPYYSIKKEIERAYGREAVQYLETLLKDVNGGMRGDERGGGMKMFSLFKKGSVAANLSVMMQQPSSFVRAMSMVKPKYFVKALNPKDLKGIKNRMYANSGAAIIKQMGRFDTNIGKSSKEWIMEGLGEETRLDAVYAGMDKWTGIGAEKADEITWCYMYAAIENEVEDNTDIEKGTERFNEAVGRRFDEVMTQTQVYDSTLAKSEWMRSTGGLDKLFTSFMAEPTLWANMMMDAAADVIEKKPGAGKNAAIAAGVFIGGSFINALLKSLSTALRRKDDEGRTFLEKYLAEVTGNFLEDVSPFGIVNMIPIARDVISVVQGYDVERADMTLIGNLWDKMEKLMKKGDEATPEEWIDAAAAAANIFGIPARNVIRDVKGLWGAFFGGANANEPSTGRDIFYSIMDNVGDTLKIGPFTPWDSKRAAYYERMEKALEDGNTALYDELRGYMEETERIKPDAVDSGIKSAVKNGYLDGRTNNEQAIKALEELGMEADKAYWTVDEWAYTKDNPDGEYKKYAAFYGAVENGVNLQSVVKRYTAHGVGTDTLASQITSQYKQRYIDLYKKNPTKAAEMKARLLTAYAALGYDRDKKIKDIDKWLKD